MRGWTLKIVSVSITILYIFPATRPAFAENRTSFYQISAEEGKSRAAEFLCELGVSYYCEERYREAIHELKKALMVDPQHKVAQEYLAESELALKRIELKEKARWERTKEKALHKALEEAREKLAEERKLWLETEEDAHNVEK